MSIQTNHYSTLEIVNSASQDEIRAAYRRMAMKWHPDRHASDTDKAAAEERFKLVQQAYDTLGDPLRRASYDMSLNDPLASMANGFHQHSSYRDFEQRRQEEMRRYQEMLPRGADVKWSVRISLLEAVQGTEVQYTRKRRIECDACEGYGWNEGECGECGGTGRRARTRNQACQHCGGLGFVQWACDVCEGKRKVDLTESFRIKVPKGAVDGSEIVAKGMGKPSKHGGLPGDLHITVRLKAESGFTFAGKDISGPIKIPFSTAMLGGRVIVPLPTGQSMSVDVPKRTNSGKKVRLSGAGLASRDGARGDVILTVAIVLPKSKRKLSAAEEHIIRCLDD